MQSSEDNEYMIHVNSIGYFAQVGEGFTFYVDDAVVNDWHANNQIQKQNIQDDGW